MFNFVANIRDKITGSIASYREHKAEAIFEKRQHEYKELEVDYPFCVIIITSHGEMIKGPIKKAPCNICIKQLSTFGCIAYGTSFTHPKLLRQLSKTAIRPEAGKSLTEVFIEKTGALERAVFKERYEKWHLKTAITEHDDLSREVIRSRDQEPSIIGCSNTIKTYVNKTFIYPTDLVIAETIDNPGIIIGDNNIDLVNGTRLDNLLGSTKLTCTTEEIVKYFYENYFGENKKAQLLIYDPTCSVLEDDISHEDGEQILQSAGKAAKKISDVERDFDLDVTRVLTEPSREYEKYGLSKPPHVYYKFPKLNTVTNNYDIWYMDTNTGKESPYEPTGQNLLISDPRWYSYKNEYKEEWYTQLYLKDNKKPYIISYLKSAFNPYTLDYKPTSDSKCISGVGGGCKTISETLSSSECGPNGCHGRTKTGTYCKKGSGGNLYCTTHSSQQHEDELLPPAPPLSHIELRPPRTVPVSHLSHKASTQSRASRKSMLCQCAKSKREPNKHCPHPAEPGSDFCGHHRNCSNVIGLTLGGRRKTRKRKN
jgi:hypothetical protein